MMQLLNNKSGYAELLERDNRFVITCLYRGKEVKAHLPNPGRLWELFFPRVKLILQENTSKNAKLHYTCMAVIKEEKPVFLHTQMINRIAEHLLTARLIPGLASARVVRPEVTYHKSRFDFLLEDPEGKIYVEVKSCSLFHERFAMFPDAPSTRGTRHVKELAALAEEAGQAGQAEEKAGGKKIRCAILFITQDSRSSYFLPEYHTDPDFARALYEARNSVSIIPAGISLTPDLQLLPEVKELTIPWHVYEKAGEDRGAYMIVLYLKDDKKITIGKLGKMSFQKGYYVYAGSAKKNLEARTRRHSRLRKNLHWHIDYLRQHTRFIAALPIRTPFDIECDLARRLKESAHWIPGPFGSSDCGCFSHLFGFRENPFDLHSFINTLLYFRMETQEKLL